MKKIVCVLFSSFALGLCLCSCGGSSDPATVASVEEGYGSDEVINTDVEEVSEIENKGNGIADETNNKVDVSSGQAKLIKKLETAYNNQDVYAIVECFDPALTNAFYATAKLLGIDSDSIKSIMPFASKAIAESGTLDNEYWGNVQLTPIEINENGNEGTIEYEVCLNYENGNNRVFNDTVAVIKVDGDWYFSAFQLNQGVEYEPIPVKSDITKADVEGELYIIGSNFHGPQGYVNEKGVEIVSPYFREMKGFYGNYCAVTMNGNTWGFIDRMGNLVTDYAFDDVSDESYNGYFAVRSESSWGLINPENGKVIECIYQDVGYVGENGLVPVKQNDYWGVIDIDGNTIVDFIYTNANDKYVGKYLGVAVNNAWGVIDEEGTRRISLDEKNVDVTIFPSGIAFIKRYTKDRKGSLLYDPNMDLVFDDLYEDYYILADDRYVFIRNMGDGGNYVRAEDTWSRWILVDGNCSVLADSLEIGDDFYGTWSETKAGENYFMEFYPEDNDGFHSSKRYMIVDATYQQPMNLIDCATGDVVLDEWIDGAYTSQSYVFDDSYWVVGSEFGWSKIFDLNNRTLVKDCDYRIYSAHTIGDYLIFETPDMAQVVDFSNHNFEDVEEYKDITFYNWGNEYNPCCAIVTDGIFYGLLTKDGLLDKGMEYTKIDYDSSLRVFTLEQGANIVKYRIAPDGTANEIE
jgi:hypothetical protein